MASEVRLEMNLVVPLSVKPRVLVTGILNSMRTSVDEHGRCGNSGMKLRMESGRLEIGLGDCIGIDRMHLQASTHLCISSSVLQSNADDVRHQASWDC